ncbi:PEGA domain-containing protein, partial [Candidatus Babeliales bacterium]|nr:PEGA domain-containing protein [Candidatus Babeliales bacterium]
LNHADIDPANIAGLVKSLDNPALVVKNLSDGTGAQALGNFIDATKKWYDTIVTQIDVTKADSWVKNNAVFARKALDSAEPAKMADIPHAAQEIASNQGKLVDDMCGGHVEPCFTETSDLIFGGGKTAADEVIAATDEFVDEATGNWFTKGKAYSKARYAKANVWYDGLSKENKERVAHAMVVAGMFFVVTVIYAIYKLTDADDVSPAYELKANIMEESYWVCEHASTAGSFDGLVVALVIFREDVMAAAKWCEDNEAALEGEETYEEFVRLVKLRMVEIIIFEARLEELGSTGVINCTSNTTFFYVDLDGKAAGFAYNTQMVQLKGIPVGSHTVKIRKHGYIPESCSKSINVTEGDPKGFDCQMTKIGDCSPVADASIYITPLSPIEDESIAFNGSADSDDPIETWEWDFGDGSPKETGQAVTHAYDTADTYIAELVVTNDCGESDTAERAIVVTEEELAESTTLAIGCPVDADGNEWDRCWDFEIWVGDKLTGCKPPHTFVFGTDVHCDCVSPYNLIDCELGTHTITVKKYGFDDVSKTVTLVKDTPQSWTPVMQLTTGDVGDVLCETTPQSAAIWIVGSYRGDTNATIVDLPAGATVVTFKKTGYDDCVKTVTVVKDSTVTASCTLVAEAAEHDISFVVPDGATLYVDNELIETTTIARLS